MSTSPFDLDGATWVGVSPRLTTVRTWISIIAAGVPLLAAAALAVVFGGWVWVAPGGCAAVLAWLLWLVHRQVPAIGYAELGDELAVRKGIMFRTLTLVPYGRMQLVDVNRGPVARLLGLAELRLVTAAATSDVTLPGLPEQEAAELRDALVARAEERRVGL